MTISINPSDEELETLISHYTTEEKILQTQIKPPPRNKLIIYLQLAFQLIMLIPTFVLIVLQLPFRLLRKIRMVYLKIKDRKDYMQDWDGGDYFFYQPKPKLTAKKKRAFDMEREHLADTEIAKIKYLKNPDDLNLLVDYAGYLNQYHHLSGKRNSLYILDQIKNLPKHSIIHYDQLYFHLGVTAFRLGFYCHSIRFMELAVANGYESPNAISSDIPKFRSDLFFEALDSLKRQMINCWPT